MFRRAVVSVADMFVADTDDGHQARWRHLAALQGLFVREGARIENVRDVLSASNRRHLNAYEQIYQQELKGCLSPAFISDLGQNPEHRNFSGSIMPSLTTHSLRHSHSSRHTFTPAEQCIAHGWAFVLSCAGKRKMPFDLNCFSMADQVSMVGNGMHLAACAAWFTWCLSNLARREVVEPLRAPPSCEEGDDGEEASQQVCALRV